MTTKTPTITLERAIALAAQAHEGDTDKAGATYILHPLRVMHGQESTEAKIVAVFHDVLEDHPETWNVERLQAEGFTQEMIDALLSVTKREGEAYEDFVLRAKANPIGRTVKMADLWDNMDLSRFDKPTEKQIARVRDKYVPALASLVGDMSDEARERGNPGREVRLTFGQLTQLISLSWRLNAHAEGKDGEIREIAASLQYLLGDAQLNLKGSP